MNYVRITEELMAKMESNFRTNFFEMFNKFSKGESCVLTFLANDKKVAVPSELSEITNSSTPRIAKILSSLEKKGLVVRKNDKTDRRKIFVKITEKGKERALKEKKEVSKLLKTVLKEMGETDAKEFFRTISKFIEISNRIFAEEGKQTK